MHVIVRRLVLIQRVKSLAVVECSCGDVFKARSSDEVERQQFQHMIEKDGDGDGSVPF